MVKHKLYEEMYKEYLKGSSLQQVGELFGITRQAVYSGFKCRNFKLRQNKKLQYVEFNGNKYTINNCGYYRKTNSNRQLLHIDVWEYHNSKIPTGYDIHHIDHDKTNNLITNLELYTKSEHSRKFATGKNQYTK